MKRVFLLACLFATLTSAAAPARRPITYTDLDAWRILYTPTVSADGRWLAYASMPQDGDGDLVIQNLVDDREYTAPLGDLPPLPTGVDAKNPEKTPHQKTSKIHFTHDASHIIATTFPSKDAVIAAQREKKKASEMPQGGLVIVSLETGATTNIADVASVQVPSRGGQHIAYHLRQSAEADTDDNDNDRDQARPGSDLILRHLETGAERVFHHVSDFTLSRDGATLVFAVSSPDENQNGVFTVPVGSGGEPSAILAGPGRYLQLTWDREQTRLAFLSDPVRSPDTDRFFAVYLWRRGDQQAAPVLEPTAPGIPAELAITADSRCSFTRDGSRLLIGLARRKPPEPKETVLPEDRVVADLWSWDADYIPPVQKALARSESKFTYTGVLDLATGHYTQVADETLRKALFTDDAARGLGFDDRPYRQLYDIDARYNDVYLVDTATGQRSRVLERFRDDPPSREKTLSPSGRHALLYHEGNWHFVDLTSGALRNATGDLRVPFWNELRQRPEPPPAYGSAGWARDGLSAFVYDRYDVWQIFVDGSPPRNITAGKGRVSRGIYRIQTTDPAWAEQSPERGIDTEHPLLLRVENEDTRNTGFASVDLRTSPTHPREVLHAEGSVRYVTRADDSDTFVITVSRFDQFPDLLATDSQFRAPRWVTSLGRQLDTFAWGSAHLIDFTSDRGEPLKAALFRPADFDPSRKYPLIVYLYERLSERVHNFVHPIPTHRLNAAIYASNGYLVLMPDISYQVGHPGDDAVACVLPAIDAVVAQGYVDENAIGIQGHSWGGYQTAYLITQTDRFRAAAAGAPVANMTSAYSGIRWGSGRARQHQYEKTQSRIGDTLFDAPDLYIHSSPVFHLANVTTPLLILHNDADEKVPWYQGIELFLGLRRLGKPAWMWNYHNGLHGLRRRADQMDYARRMYQFFEHYLKGAPAPAWMTDGVPYEDREAEKQRFRAQLITPHGEESTDHH